MERRKAMLDRVAANIGDSSEMSGVRQFGQRELPAPLRPNEGTFARSREGRRVLSCRA